MHLRVLHRTRYHYRLPVIDSYNEVRLRPATENPDRLTSYLLRVHPPRRVQHFRDEHLNYVQYFEIPEPHHELIIEANSKIHTTTQYPDGLAPTGVTFDDMGGEQDDMHRPFLHASRYVSIEQDIWRLALDIRDERKDVFETAVAIMGYIHANWTYKPLATSASTHMDEVMRDRRGVCQDFAHVMLGLCRALGIPARYVSGYLYNEPTGQLLRGAQASHAWCEICLPGRGWFGLDPTNNTLTDERYVKIATGRDYDDAAPIRGSFSGAPGATAALEVTVEVERI